MADQENPNLRRLSVARELINTTAGKKRKKTDYAELLRPIDGLDGRIYSTKGARAPEEEPALTDEITAREIKRTMSKMGSGKAPGPDGLSRDLLLAVLSVPARVADACAARDDGEEVMGRLKDGAAAFSGILTAYLGACMRLAATPAAEKRATLTPIRKDTGSASPLVGDTRPIGVKNITGNILQKIVADRLTRTWNEHHVLHVAQHAFRPNRRVAQCVTTAQLYLETESAAGRQANLLLLDMYRAYDTVTPEAVEVALLRLRIPPAIVALIMDKFAGASASVKVRGATSRTIKLQRGVRQGDPDSPNEFIAVADIVATAMDQRGARPTEPG